jgi:hypothetical protein
MMFRRRSAPKLIAPLAAFTHTTNGNGQYGQPAYGSVLGHAVQTGYSSLRHERGSSGWGFGVRSSIMLK